MALLDKHAEEKRLGIRCPSPMVLLQMVPCNFFITIRMTE